MCNLLWRIYLEFYDVAKIAFQVQASVYTWRRVSKGTDKSFGESIPKSLPLTRAKAHFFPCTRITRIHIFF